MLRKICVLAFLTGYCFQPALGQAEEQVEETFSAPKQRQFAFGVTSGIGNLVVRDRVISNYLYSGNYVPLGLHFESRGPERRLFVNMEFFNKPTLRTKTNEGFSYKGDLGDFFPDKTDGLDFSTLRTSKWRVQTGLSYLLKKTENKKLQTFLGYDLSVNVFQKEFLQFEYVNKLQDRVWSLGFVLYLERHFNNKHHLEYYLSLPVLSQAKRTLTNQEASPVTITSSKFTILASVLGFDSRFTYRFQVNSRFSLRATYALQYLQITFPEKEKLAYSQGVVGLFLHF